MLGCGGKSQLSSFPLEQINNVISPYLPDRLLLSTFHPHTNQEPIKGTVLAY